MLGGVGVGIALDIDQRPCVDGQVTCAVVPREIPEVLTTFLGVAGASHESLHSVTDGGASEKLSTSDR